VDLSVHHRILPGRRSDGHRIRVQLMLYCVCTTNWFLVGVIAIMPFTCLGAAAYEYLNGKKKDK
jgi:hypothetical protein